MSFFSVGRRYVTLHLKETTRTFRTCTAGDPDVCAPSAAVEAQLRLRSSAGFEVGGSTSAARRSCTGCCREVWAVVVNGRASGGAGTAGDCGEGRRSCGETGASVAPRRRSTDVQAC